MNLDFTLFCIQLFYQTGDAYYLEIMDTECDVVDTVVNAVMDFELSQTQQQIVAPQISDECIHSILEYASIPATS